MLHIFAMCTSKLEIDYGIFLSCENLNKSKKAGTGNLSHSKTITGTLELCLSSEPHLSSRVWLKCALKIRNAAERLKFICKNINVPLENSIKNKGKRLGIRQGK